MSEPLAHLYALALRALDEQERRAEALRGRLGPVLAAAALGTSLLSGPVIGGERPTSIAGAIAIAIAVGGLIATLVAGGHVLVSRRNLSFEIDAAGLRTAVAGAIDDLAGFYDAMIMHLDRHRAFNARAIEQLEMAFTAMLCSILVMQCGLALAAIVG